MSNITTPNIPPAETIDELRKSITSALDNLTEQINSQVADQAVDSNMQRIENVAHPTSLFDAVNKLYVDQKVDELTLIGRRGSNADVYGVNPFSINRDQHGFVTFNGLQVPNDRNVFFEVISIDETDIGWRGGGSIVLNTDTATLTITGTSRYGQRICSVAVTSAGSGLDINTKAIVSGGGGTGGKIDITISSGSIASARVSNPGWGYTSTPSVTFTGTNTTASLTPRLYGFIPDDYIVWNEPAKYEINRIKNISFGTSTTIGTFTFYSSTATVTASTTINRTAYFNSTSSAHTTKSFYLCTPYTFNSVIKHVPSEKLEFVHSNKCVLAAYSPYTSTNSMVNTNYGTDTGSYAKQAPGLRTMLGAAYTLGFGTGTATVGQNADARIKTQGWHSLRNVYAQATNKPAGTNAGMVITVVYINTGGTVGLLDTVTIGNGTASSWPSGYPPNVRNMPYQISWTPSAAGGYAWPPNLLPLLNNALDTNGRVVTGYSLDTTGSVLFEPDGDIDFVVTTVGNTTAGGGVTVTVQV